MAANIRKLAPPCILFPSARFGGDTNIFHIFWFHHGQNSIFTRIATCFFFIRQTELITPIRDGRVDTDLIHEFTWELSTSKFEPELHQFPEATPTLFCQRSRSLWRDFSFALTVHHQIGGSGFCHRRSITRVSCSRFDMAPITKRSLV